MLSRNLARAEQPFREQSALDAATLFDLSSRESSWKEISQSEKKNKNKITSRGFFFTIALETETFETTKSPLHFSICFSIEILYLLIRNLRDLYSSV